MKGNEAKEWNEGFFCEAAVFLLELRKRSRRTRGGFNICSRESDPWGPNVDV